MSGNSKILGRLGTFWQWVILAAFLGSFYFSFLIYSLHNEFKSYTLLFPSAKSTYQGEHFSKLYAEHRKIPKPQIIPPAWTERERRVYYLIKEPSYGPGPRIIRSYPFLPFGTKVNDLAIQANRVYIDFDQTFLTGTSEYYFDSESILALVKKVVQLNFPKIKEIYFTVEGFGIPQYRKYLIESGQLINS